MFQDWREISRYLDEVHRQTGDFPVAVYVSEEEYAQLSNQWGGLMDIERYGGLAVRGVPIQIKFP